MSYNIVVKSTDSIREIANGTKEYTFDFGFMEDGCEYNLKFAYRSEIGDSIPFVEDVSSISIPELVTGNTYRVSSDIGSGARYFSSSTVGLTYLKVAELGTAQRAYHEARFEDNPPCRVVKPRQQTFRVIQDHMTSTMVSAPNYILILHFEKIYKK